MTYLKLKILLGTIFIATNVFAAETQIMAVNGNAGEITDSNVYFVKGVFNAAPRDEHVSLLCLNSNDVPMRAGPTEPVACGANPTMADLKEGFPDKGRLGRAYILGRNFGINTSEFFADFSNYKDFVEGSSAEQVQQAFHFLRNSSGWYEWKYSTGDFPERVQYKAPGTGPHIHLGILSKKGTAPLAFTGDQKTLDVLVKMEIPTYKKTSSNAHSSSTLTVVLQSRKKNSSSYKSISLIISTFNDQWNGKPSEAIKSDGRNGWISSKFHPDTIYGTAKSGKTKTKAFGPTTFRYSISKSQMTKMLSDYNKFVTDEEKVLTQNFDHIKLEGIQLRNESTNLHNENVTIHIRVDVLKALRVY